MSLPLHGLPRSLKLIGPFLRKQHWGFRTLGPSIPHNALYLCSNTVHSTDHYRDYGKTQSPVPQLVVGQDQIGRRHFHRLSKQSIEIRPLSYHNQNTVVELLLTDFRTEEPLYHYLELKSKECHPYFMDVVRTGLPDNCSYAAIDSTNGLLCAARINSIVKAPIPVIPEGEITALRQSSGLKYMLQIMNLCESKIFDNIPASSRVIKLDILSVAKYYQNKRIATTLNSLTLERAAQVDPETGEPRFTHAAVVATSARAQHIYTHHLQFETAFELPVKEFIGFDTNRPFIDFRPEDAKVKLMMKSLV